MTSRFWSLYSQYQVQPIVMFPSDKPTDTLYLYGVKAALSDVRLWYKQKLGRTFTVGRPFIFRCPKPEANMDPLDLIPQFVAAANLCGGIANQKRVYVLFPWTWNFVVATYDGTEASPAVHLYRNAVDQLTTGATTEAGAYVAMEDTASLFRVGSQEGAGGTATIVAEGYLALPFVTGKELTAAEVTSLYGLGRTLIGA